MRTWVDTDFGFDDLWALLLLRHLEVTVDGVSLVAGNTPLQQVAKNAEASLVTFGFEWPVFKGADKPLQREPETAIRILGQYGMCSRGRFLPYDQLTTKIPLQDASAIPAMAAWLDEDGPHQVIALGPLTNLAMLQLQYPDISSKIAQITWLGGSRGRGNHSQYAEYNALADAEALSIVADSGIPLTMIDLEMCRQVSFAESDIPTMRGKNRQLLSDLLGGYLDIALQRGRSAMSIYDPLAVLSAVKSDLFSFVPASLAVQTEPKPDYGRTIIDIATNESTHNFQIAVSADTENVRKFCMSALINA